MTSSNDVDYNLKKAIFLLHSDDPQSATELRIMLDELIKQRYGPSKMLVHLVTPKHLELERSFPGIATERSEPEPDPEPMSVDTAVVDEVINLTNSPVKTISDSPDTIPDSDDCAMLTIPTNEEVENLKEFGDLNCCVCGEMMFTATNRLIECSQCGSLYHQECHKPTITNEETCDEKERTWQCNNCNDKPSTSRAAAAAAAASSISAAIDEPISLITKAKSSGSSSRSSSSSNSSSPFYKQEHSSSSSSKHHKSSSSSSKSQKEDRSGGGGSSSTRTSRVITPAINIVSGPDKTATQPSSSSSKSKSSSLHSSSSKSSSSKSSSKHHESSKRKLGK